MGEAAIDLSQSYARLRSPSHCIKATVRLPSGLILSAPRRRWGVFLDVFLGLTAQDRLWAVVEKGEGRQGVATPEQVATRVIRHEDFRNPVSAEFCVHDEW